MVARSTCITTSDMYEVDEFPLPYILYSYSKWLQIFRDDIHDYFTSYVFNCISFKTIWYL